MSSAVTPSWSIARGEAIYPAFHVKDEVVYPANYKTLSGYQKQGVDSNIQGAARRVVERKKAAASFGLLGLVLAAGLGLIGGWAAGSRWRPWHNPHRDRPPKC